MVVHWKGRDSVYRWIWLCFQGCAMVARCQSQSSHALKPILRYNLFTLNGTLIYLETIDWDRRLIWELFTEVINQGGSRAIFSLSFFFSFWSPWSRPPLATEKNAGLRHVCIEFTLIRSSHFICQTVDTKRHRILCRRYKISLKIAKTSGVSVNMWSIRAVRAHEHIHTVTVSTLVVCGSKVRLKRNWMEFTVSCIVALWLNTVTLDICIQSAPPPDI